MSTNGNGRQRFGDYELDSHSGRLFRDGQPVKIQPQPLRVLGVLVEHAGEIVSREQLRTCIWGNATFVEFDQGLNYCIRQIRLALRDEVSEPVYIETLPKQGYRFIAPIAANGHISPSAPPVIEDESHDHPVAAAVPVPALPKQTDWKVLGGAIFLLALLTGGAFFGIMRRPPNDEPVSYTQITSFTDAAVAPALSPDGRMVAFYRSDHSFVNTNQIYVKLLPHGEPVQVTHDPHMKYNVAFSPDGSRIAYTVIQDTHWNTYTVSSLGGDPDLFLSNAAGLTWLDEHRLLFSEIRSGAHMGIATAVENLAEHREIYFPDHERAMAHYSYASPDRKWALVVEMDPDWGPCRLIPLAGGSPGRQVGPRGPCTSAGWSPDGSWMYFGAEMEGRRHLWRQRFPDGQPEQITSGLTEEEGVAVAPDGRSLITSVMTRQSAVWIHDSSGDRALTTEGYAAATDDTPSLSLSSDGKRLYYLLRRDSPESPAELRRTDLDSGRDEVVLPGVSIREFDISGDEKEVVYSTRLAGQSSQLWLAPLDRSAPPHQVGETGDASPHFGPDGQVLFRLSDGKAFYLASMGRDGSHRIKVAPTKVFGIRSISPDRRLVLVRTLLPESKIPNAAGTMTISVAQGRARRVCDGGCPAAWSPDGKYFYKKIAGASRTNPSGKMAAIPVPPGETLPSVIPFDLRSAQAIAGIRIIEQGDVTPGLDPSTYVHVKAAVHANLFRIPLLR